MGDISYAFRSLRKSPLASLTIIVTVALGLGMVASVFTFLNVFLFRADNVPNIHELYGVERPRTAEGDLVRLTRPVYEALRRETAVFTDVFAMVGETDSRVNGRTMGGALVTGNFFEVLGVGAVRGRVLTPADDERRQPVVVLSDRGWSTHFDNDPAVLERGLLINGVRYDIVGVMPKGFRGLMVGTPDYWAPLSMIYQLQPALAAQKQDIDVDIIGRLRPGLSREVAQEQLIAWDARRNEGTERRSAGITLVPRRGTIPQPMEAVLIFTPLFASFGLILLIGCANVASLLLARAVSRQKEVGVRLSLGASRGQIVRQLLTESVILALVAAVFGYAISRLILETTIWAVMSTMPPDIGDVRLLVPEGDWRVGVFLTAAAVIASIMFGLAPALQATRIELVRTMRGEFMPDARPGRTRNVLIGIQVTASALLLISAGIFLRSAFASATVDPGMRTSDTAIVPVVNEQLRQRVVDAVTRDPLVAAVAASLPDPVFGSIAALAESEQSKSTAAYKFVTPEFFSVLGIDIVRGRTFTAAEGGAVTSAGVAIVAESFAREMWPNGDALGQAVRLERDPAQSPGESKVPPLTGSFTIVGVARDVPGFAFGERTPTNVYVPITSRHAGTILAVRVHGDPERARSALLERLTAVDPNIEQIVTLRTVSRMATYFLQIAFWLTLVLGGLALILTLSGVFSVMSYLVEQRTKEIGVRMALGATANDVARLVLGQTAKPVGIGLVVGAALSLATGILLLTNLEPIGQIVRLLDPIAYVGSVLIIILACAFAAWVPTMKATHIDPMKSLRHE
jgi:predicted permease